MSENTVNSPIDPDEIPPVNAIGNGFTKEQLEKAKKEARKILDILKNKEWTSIRFPNKLTNSDIYLTQIENGRFLVARLEKNEDYIDNVTDVCEEASSTDGSYISEDVAKTFALFEVKAIDAANVIESLPDREETQIDKHLGDISNKRLVSASISANNVRNSLKNKSWDLVRFNNKDSGKDIIIEKINSEEFRMGIIDKDELNLEKAIFSEPSRIDGKKTSIDVKKFYAFFKDLEKEAMEAIKDLPVLEETVEEEKETEDESDIEEAKRKEKKKKKENENQKPKKRKEPFTKTASDDELLDDSTYRFRNGEPDDCEIKTKNGGSVEYHKASPQKPKWFDDGMPGIIVKINGKTATREDLLEFIKEHHDEFVDALNNTYLADLESLGKNRANFLAGDTKPVPPEHRYSEKSEIRKNESKDNLRTKPYEGGDYDKGRKIITKMLHKYPKSAWRDISFPVEDPKTGETNIISLSKQIAENDGQIENKINPKAITISPLKKNGEIEETACTFKVLCTYVSLHEKEFVEAMEAAIEKERGGLSEKSTKSARSDDER